MLILPPGEATKSYENLIKTCEFLLQACSERTNTAIAFGGGVMGDLTGLACALVRRGISFIQIPTTLLAQVDSSVGGKTAINSPLGKNLIGVFHQPIAVLTDIATLKTLPRREMLAGYAEMVKYGLLGDIEFFEWLDENAGRILSSDPQAQVQAIRASCEAKAKVVQTDELKKVTGHCSTSATRSVMFWKVQPVMTVQYCMVRP